MKGKRGRPRSIRPKHDTGTPELAAKRAAGLTAEALDLCLERGIISQQQHWCGVHLRWLYTLRYGVPGVRALDIAHAGGVDIRTEDAGWRASREAEYQHMLKTLGVRLHTPLLAVCVFNEKPEGLGRVPRSMHKARDTAGQLEALREGFAALEALWCRKKT